MARFVVYRLREAGDYVLDCQANLLSSLQTRLVVPMLPLARAPKPATRLNPLFDIEGETLVMVTQFAASLPLRDIGEQVCSLEDRDATILNALDMLITGY